MLISGVTVVKNGVVLGYPFVESILSLLPLCDELVISEGYSDDDTLYWLERLQNKYPDKIRIFRDEWPKSLLSGHAIGEIQTRALKRCRGKWCYLLQADEIMPPENIDYLRRLCRPRRLLERVIGRRRFNSYYVDCVHVVDNFQRCDRDYGRTDTQDYGSRWAVRLVRNRPFIRSGGDGWSFEGAGCYLIGAAALPSPIFHVGYNFPVNKLRKRINHALLYPEAKEGFDTLIAQDRQCLADYESGVLPPLSTDNPLCLPSILAPLIGQSEYKIREELFD
jgi:glycosyltransferase involved in cell wall biosynthesis